MSVLHCHRCGRDHAIDAASQEALVAVLTEFECPCQRDRRPSRICETCGAIEPLCGCAKAGVCATCGRDLVQIPGDRTYHPAAVMPPDDHCPALLLIPGTEHRGFNVPDDQFIESSPA